MITPDSTPAVGLDEATAHEVRTTFLLARRAVVPGHWFGLALAGVVALVGGVLAVGAWEDVQFRDRYHLIRDPRPAPPTVEVRYQETHRPLSEILGR